MKHLTLVINRALKGNVLGYYCQLVQYYIYYTLLVGGYWLVLSPTVIFSWVGILKLRIQSCALFKKERCWISKACLLLNNYYTWLEYLGKYIPTHAWTLEVSPGKAQLSREDLAWITDNINPHVISWYLARSQRIKLYTLNERRLSDRNY